MLTVERKVYYCEFCKRHRMTAAAILKHEPRCIYNPDRSACGWHEPHIRIERPADYVDEYRCSLDTDWLRKKMEGCPACMLSVVVQSDLSSGDRDDTGFDYAAEVERFRSEERRDYAF